MSDVLSGISTAHLSNLLSPVFMRYCVHPKTIDLRGPNGAASFHSKSITSIPFSEFSLLPLANIRQFHLDLVHPSCTMPFDHLSFFPAIETFIVSGADLSLLSTLLSNPSASSSLKTLAFWDCVLTEEFMKDLTQFASNRKKTALAWLHRVVVVHSDGILPSVASIRGLEEHIPVVDARIATELPMDLFGRV